MLQLFAKRLITVAKVKMKLKMKKIIGIIILAFSLVSCNERSNENDTLLAEAYGVKLYMSDIADFVYSNDIIADSANAISAYTAAWVHRQLMTKKAEELLDEKQKDVTAEIEDYRSSLLIYRLEQDYIDKNVDTAVTHADIEKVYNNDKNLFIVQSTLIKAIYIKIQTDMPEIENIKRLLNSSNDKKLEELCLLYAEEYDNFSNNWVYIYELLRLLPPNISAGDLEKTFQTYKVYDTKDAKYSYFIKQQAILPTGSVSPFEKERENIRNIILNKRKRELIQKFEKEIYNEGIDNNNAKIYINNNN